MPDNAKNYKDLTFANKQYKQTLKSHQHVLTSYKYFIDNIDKLVGQLPIVLDTSVILRIYEISFKAREKIKQFLKIHKTRIILTGQVQFEFVKNREKVINSFQEEVTEQLPKDFNSNVITKLSSFINSNKVKLEDYEEIQNKLSSLQATASELFEEIQEKVNDKKGSAKSLLYEDDFLNIFKEVVLLENMEESYLQLIKEQFKQLHSLYKASTVESYTLTAFPGCAEKGDKDDPTGDLIIYHEMMKYAVENETDLVFLTNDTTKGDWMRKDGNPHLHYIENFYLNTKQMIYILNSERLFERLFETSFESLITEKQEPPRAIDRLEIQNYLEKNSLFEAFSVTPIRDALINELTQNKIYTIEDLDIKLKYANFAIPEIISFIPTATKAGALKLCLELLNNEYVRKPWKDVSELKVVKLKKYWKENYGWIF